MAGNAYIPGLADLGRIRLIAAVKLRRVSSQQYGLLLSGLALPVIALSVCFAHFYPALIPFSSILPLFGLAVFVAFFPVTISPVGIAFNAVLPVSIATLYLFGPLAAIAVQLIAVCVQMVVVNFASLIKSPSEMGWRLLHAGSQHIISLGVPSIAYAALVATGRVTPHSGKCFVALCIVSMGAFYLQACLTTTLASISHRLRWDVVWYEHYRWTLLSVVLMSPLGFVTGAVAEQSVVFGLLFLLLPLAAAQRGYDLHVRKLSVYRQGVDLLGRLMQEAHPYTHGHLHRVASWAKKIAVRVGLPPSSMSLIEDAAILHDIGKIAIDDRILNKIGRLDDSDWVSIKQHPDTGADVVSRIRYLERVSRWIRHHHERVDGMGYPSGLAVN